MLKKAKPNLRLMTLNGAAWLASPDPEWRSIQLEFALQQLVRITYKFKPKVIAPSNFITLK